MSIGVPVLVWRVTYLQVTLAVVICSTAHVLHAVYKPWGQGTQTCVLRALQGDGM